MIVGLDVSPLHTGHKVRGIGFYTKRLLQALKKQNKNIEIKELKSPQDIKQQDYDLLHIPYFHPYFQTLPWPWQVNKPIIVTLHDMIPVKYPNQYPPGMQGEFKWYLQKLLLKQVDFVITDSFASKYDISDLAGYPADKIYVTYLAAGNQFKQLDPKKEQLKKTQQKYNLPDDFVLYVGDINWNKNIPSLVNACNQAELPLVIVGKQAVNPEIDKDHIENKDLVWLQKKADNNPLINTVGFVSMEELISLYNLATVYVQPSFDEGFGLPVLEAMACGCPVVSSNFGSLPEVVGEAAIKVEPTKERLAKKIDLVINDKKIQKELSEKGIKRASEFSWQKTASKTVEIYKLAKT
jgi:glycosyltransferase involved in cell wall biosynthesis